MSVVELEYTEIDKGKLVGTGTTTTLQADQMFRAIGQSYEDCIGASLKLKNGRIVTNLAGNTSLKNVWAGGDCVVDGDDLTVTAVAQGRDSAEDIHKSIAES